MHSITSILPNGISFDVLSLAHKALVESDSVEYPFNGPEMRKNTTYESINILFNLIEILRPKVSKYVLFIYLFMTVRDFCRCL